MSSSRRTLLGSVGAALTGLAGCLDAVDDGSTDTATPTPTPVTPAMTDAALGESVDVDDVTVTVSEFRAPYAIRYLSAPDAFGVTAADDGRFVVVQVSAAGGDTPPAPDAFSLVVDGTAYESGIEAVGPARIDAPATGRAYGGATRRGYLGFRVPAPLDATDVAIHLADAARWTVPPSTLAALRSPPPSFTTTVSVPDSVAADEAVPVRLDVTNEGDGGGVFRGALNHQGPLYAADAFTFSLPSGESTTHELGVDYYRGSDSPPERVQFGVVGPGLSESFEVRIEGGGTPGGTATEAGDSA